MEARREGMVIGRDASPSSHLGINIHAHTYPPAYMNNSSLWEYNYLNTFVRPIIS